MSSERRLEGLPYMACDKGNYECIELLLAHGADANIRTNVSMYTMYE